jgi:peroxiredoxin
MILKFKICFAMKRILLFLLLPVFSAAQISSMDFKISVEVKGLTNLNRAYLKYGSKTDTAKIINGSVLLEGDLVEPGIAQLALKTEKDTDPFGKKEDRLVLFLAPGYTNIVINDSIQNHSIESIAHRQYMQLLEENRQHQKEIDKIWKDVKEYKLKGDLESAKKKSQEAIERFSEVYVNFVKRNISSPVVIFALNEVAGWLEVDVAKAEPLFAMLPGEVRQWPSAVQLKERLETAKRTAVGKTAPDFSQPDTTGKRISLSSFKGKYVLVDFWASWCGPCRKENPNLIKAYSKYRDSNFTILGVSFDRHGQKDKWIEAIRKDGLLWTQISELNGFENNAAKLYAIKGLPSNLLIDPNGKIIAKNLYREDLNSFLDPLFKN